MNRATKLLIVNIFFILAITWAVINVIGAPEIELLAILSITIVASGIGNAIILRGAPE